MGIFATIGAGIEAIRWLHTQKKQIEENANAYFSEARAARWRLLLETTFKALEDGEANPNFKRLPKIVRWFCGPTKVDNVVGRFGQKLLKSGKIERSDPVLRTMFDFKINPTAALARGDLNTHARDITMKAVEETRSKMSGYHQP